MCSSDLIRYVGAVPVPLHLEETANFTFSPDELAAKITPKTKLIYLNFPSNPTGAVVTGRQLEEYAEVILEHCRPDMRSEEHTSELQSLVNLVCRLLLEKKKNQHKRCHEDQQRHT